MVIIVWKLTTSAECGVATEIPDVTVSGNDVLLGTPLGDTSMSNCIHGASALLPTLVSGMKYQVTFEYNLFTWDSYNAVSRIAGTGYFDSFSVSVSSTPYQSLVGLTDPITTTNLPGLGFIWGGTNYSDSTLECSPASALCAGLTPGLATVTMIGAAGNNYLNVVLDTKTPPESNHLHPSYGKVRIVSIVQVP